MRGPDRTWRDWALLFQPRALETGWLGYAFAVLCILSLALIAAGDVGSGYGTSIGSFEAIPIIAAGWLLSDPLLLVVAASAVLSRLAVTLLGGEALLTAVVELAVVPFLAVVARTGAVAVAAALDSAARESLVSSAARIAISAAPLDEILSQVLAEACRAGLRRGSTRPAAVISSAA